MAFRVSRRLFSVEEYHRMAEAGILGEDDRVELIEGDLVDQARADLELARTALEKGFYEWACFASQQAAEKAVKAVFQKLHREAWGHSVAALLEALSREVSLPEGLYEMALELDKAYIPTRYPNAHPRGSPRQLYTKGEAQRLIGYVEEVLAFCEGLLASL